MAKSKNIFQAGKMNKDADERLVQQGEYRDALNASVLTSAGAGMGAMENVISNQAITTSVDLDFGENPVTLGSIADDSLNKIFWFVKSDDGSYIAEYDKDNSLATIVLKDTRSGNLNILSFSKSNYIEANTIYDNDNGNILLFFTDGITDPKRIEVNTAKTWGANNFVKSDITVIVKPPVYPPTLTLQSTSSGYENNLKEKFVYFAYRYKYKLGELTPLSPFSQVAFNPYNFNFDYSIASNESMLNQINQAVVSFNVGDDKIESVQVIFKVAGDETLYVIDNFKKSKKGWADNTNQSITFDNSKIYGVLDPRELRRYYDNVPLTARTQNLIGNRLVYGNYTENFDLKDCNGSEVTLDVNASYTSTVIPDSNIGNSYNTVKTNRDYELGLVYLDDFGRSTTVLIGDNNTVFVPGAESDKSTDLSLSINHLPPKFANHFRIFVKQNKTNYQTILPSVFYSDVQTGQVYILLNTSDIDKVKPGDFIIVKSDTTGKKSNIVETKVLDVVKKEINFLEDSDYPESGDPAIGQINGTYMVIKPVGFRMNVEDYDTYEREDHDASRDNRTFPLPGYSNPSTNPASIEGPFYYGTTSDVNDLAVSGTYSNTQWYARIVIEIDGVGDGVSTFDTFSWNINYRDDGNTTAQSANGVVITPGTPQLLADGVEVNFALASTHDLNDKWTLNLKPENPHYDPDDFGYVAIEGLPKDKEQIRPGTIINIEYDEWDDEVQFWTYQFTSDGSFQNIEEWFHESTGTKSIFNSDFVENSAYGGRIFFERGTHSNGLTTITRNVNDPMHMIFRSFGDQASYYDDLVKLTIKTKFIVRSSKDELCFETKPVEDTSSLFYEVPFTWDITSQGYHSGNINQDNTTAASITIPFHNAWGWGNCVESFKIRDLFNSPSFVLENRPLTDISDYRKSFRTSSLTYSGVYEQSTKVNGLNDFNLAEVNYKDLDDKYGDVNKIIPRDTDLIIFQENRVSRVLLNKNVLYNADGSGNVTSASDILGTVIAYAGEYGVTKNQFSVVLWGTRIYFVDERRGSVCRLSRDGIEQISDFGMNDWFRDRLKSEGSKRIIGGYDPHTREFVLSLQETLSEWRPDLVECEIIYDDDAPPTSTTSTSSTTLEPTTTTTTEQFTTSTTTDFFF